MYVSDEPKWLRKMKNKINMSLMVKNFVHFSLIYLGKIFKYSENESQPSSLLSTSCVPFSKSSISRAVLLAGSDFSLYFYYGN